MNVLITGGRVIDPANGVDQTQDLFIRDGKIAGFDDPTREIAVDKTLDARGLVVCPGLVDLQARLREPGEEHKATLDTELVAAVAGGASFHHERFAQIIVGRGQG